MKNSLGTNKACWGVLALFVLVGSIFVAPATAGGPDPTNVEVELTKAKYVPNKKGTCGTGVFTFKPRIKAGKLKANRITLRLFKGLAKKGRKVYKLGKLSRKGKALKVKKLCRNKRGDRTLLIGISGNQVKGGFEEFDQELVKVKKKGKFRWVFRQPS